MGRITNIGGDTGLWHRKITEGLAGVSRRIETIEALAIESGQAILDLGCGGVIWFAILRWQLEIMAAPLLFRYYGIVDASREQNRDWIIECTKSFGLIAHTKCCHLKCQAS
ncbi:MAG: hypothetical protein IIC58_01560 [Proteobacteria bacterium]|nr:hypothetical protein [Pseudomonadota bacterium]